MRLDTECLLDIDGLTKRYGSLVAVNDLSLRIRPGEIFALLGPNGAGKTTLIGCVTGLIQQFEGRAAVAGRDVRDDYRTTRRLIGLVPQEVNFDGFFTARQLLHYQGGYFGVRTDRARIEQLLDDFSLLDKADVNTRRLSGGMKRRLMICKALMHEPSLLFLDEPTAGVDVELREELWQYVLDLRARGVTVFLTTHYLEEAERLADRIGILNRGRLLRVQGREAMLAEFGRSWLALEVNPAPDGALLERLHAFQPRLDADGRLHLTCDHDDGGAGSWIDSVLVIVREAGRAVRSVSSGRRSLESIFRELVHADQGRTYE